MLSLPWMSKTAQPELPRLGYSVRLEWSDGSHSHAGYTRSRPRIDRKHRSMRNYWRRGPGGPESANLVLISRYEWRLPPQRGHCRHRDCKNSLPEGPETML